MLILYEKKRNSNMTTQIRTITWQYSFSESCFANYGNTNKSLKGQQSLMWVQHAKKVNYGLFSNQGR